MRIKIKICGVTNVADANLVASLGADYLGLNFYKDSPRKVSLKMAKDIVSKMPPFTIPIGVFVDENIDELVKTVKKSGIKMVQLHGGESPEYCRQVKEKTTLPVIKAFRVSDETIFENILTYKDSCDYYLFDAYLEGQPGGTGEVFNWDLVTTMKMKGLAKPFFLAGGLTPDNVAQAIEKVESFAVDVASGVERLPTKKDFDKMKEFVRNARGL